MIFDGDLEMWFVVGKEGSKFVATMVGLWLVRKEERIRRAMQWV